MISISNRRINKLGTQIIREIKLSKTEHNQFHISYKNTEINQVVSFISLLSFLI